MIGVSLDSRATSFSTNSSWSVPRWPELLQVQRVDQRDDVHAGDVEAVPAVAAGARAERLAILLARVVDRVVFTGHGEHVRRVQPGQHLLDLIELIGRGQVGEVAGVDHEVRCVAEAVDLVDGVAERVGHVGVRRAVEADVAVADLGEPQSRAWPCCAAPADPATWEITSPPATVSPTAAPNQALWRISCRRVMPCGSCSALIWSPPRCRA